MKFVDVFQFFNYLSEEMSRCNCFSTGRQGKLGIMQLTLPVADATKSRIGGVIGAKTVQSASCIPGSPSDLNTGDRIEGATRKGSTILG